MTDAAREAQREYMREWRKKNPDKVKKNIDAYWERKAEKSGLEAQKTAENRKEAG